jgi:catechol 2,3-dioxygenase-like lactoylglutathione lyase family enzyme
MLGQFASATMIPARDLEGTARWYRDVLGLNQVSQDEGAVVFRSGAGGQVNVYQTEAAGTAQHTLIGWSVDDLDGVVDGLAARGVVFERYDLPGITTDERGVAQMGEERAAWFKDPEGNTLSLWLLHA